MAATGTRLAVIDTRIPPGSVFLIRDLRSLMAHGVTLDLFLFDPAALDPGLRGAVESAGGTVHRMLMPWARGAALAFLRECFARPHRVAGDLAAVLGIAMRSPREAARHLVVLPGSLAAIPRLRALGTTQLHGLWSGVPTTACWWIRRHASFRYSFSAHAWDLTVHTALHARKVRDAVGVAVCSEWGARTLTTLAGEAAAGRVHVVHHGLDLSEWTYRGGARPADGTPPLVLGVGRLTRVKGFDDLVRAAALLRDAGVEFRCEIVGGDERGHRAELETLIAERGVGGIVTLAGEQPIERVREVMSRADLLVCPFVDRESSTSGSRGIPNVVPEAMALGTPVITTDAGGLREMVRDGDTGRLVPQRDPAALARVIQAALADPDATLGMARRARGFVETTHEIGHTTLAFLDATGLAAARTRSKVAS